MMKKVFLLLIVAISASCATQQQISYFQDVRPNVEFGYVEGKSVTVQPEDMLSIVVSSKNPELAVLFNLPRIQQLAGDNSTLTSYNNRELSGYTVNSKGFIDFPVLGEVHIAGQTKEEIAETIKNALITNDLVKDPIVTVAFINLQFSVMGEVDRPGRYNLEKNQTTILEALSMAGDLTIYGQRDKVFLTRDINGKKITYQIDLRTHNVYQSPAYFVQQNDIIYVEPNKVRANQSTVNGNTIQSTSFWISLASLLTTITVLFVN